MAKYQTALDELAHSPDRGKRADAALLQAQINATRHRETDDWLYQYLADTDGLGDPKFNGTLKQAFLALEGIQKGFFYVSAAQAATGAAGIAGLQPATDIAKAYYKAMGRAAIILGAQDAEEIAYLTPEETAEAEKARDVFHKRGGNLDIAQTALLRTVGTAVGLAQVKAMRDVYEQRPEEAKALADEVMRHIPETYRENAKTLLDEVTSQSARVAPFRTALEKYWRDCKHMPAKLLKQQLEASELLLGPDFTRKFLLDSVVDALKIRTGVSMPVSSYETIQQSLRVVPEFILNRVKPAIFDTVQTIAQHAMFFEIASLMEGTMVARVTETERAR